MNKNSLLKTVSIICALILVAAVVLSAANVLQLAGVSYENAKKYTAGDADISGTVRNLDVDWTGGRVTVRYHNGSGLRLSETADRAIPADQRLRWWLDGDTLRVRYRKPGLHLFRFGSLQKELTLDLPEGISFDGVSIGVTSGDISISSLKTENLDLRATSGSIHTAAEAQKVSVQATSGDVALNIAEKSKELTIHTTSADILLNAGNADKIQLSSTSGDMKAAVGHAAEMSIGSTSGNVLMEIGEAEKVKIETTSGDITAGLISIDSLTVHSTSGDVSLSLPEDPGFSAKLKTASGSVSYDLPLSKQGTAYVCGNGAGTLDVSTTSGNITLNQK